ncbi:MAG: hypothetical protein Q9163_003725 [Psora crenata]
MMRTLSGEITIDEALAAEQNMLLRLTYDQKRSNLLDYLHDHKSQIEAMVSYHLNFNTTSICSITPESEWIHGSFNICIPVYVNDQTNYSKKRVIIRFPLPYKIGEENFPGNTDEKLRCEAATYIWIQEKCPDVHVPQLLGFAFSNNYCVLENEGVPTNIRRTDTYTSTEPYIFDLLAYHDSLLRHRPNSINDQFDCRAQMAVITGMRAVLPHFLSRDLRNGPFLLTLTDIHQNNIFVDEQWHIKYLIDLEWACSLPMEMQNAPYWLTSHRVDDLTGENLVTYNNVHEEFMAAFETEEKLQRGTFYETDTLVRTRAIRKAWMTGSYFYFHALESTTGLFNLFLQHIWPKFPASMAARHGFDEAVSPFWSFDTDEVTAMKMQDREDYDASLRALFETKARSSAGDE